MAPRKNLPSETRRLRTVEAVVALCAREDPATVTTERIARRMRVTQGALFRHFPNKDAIWEAVLSWVGDRVLGRIVAAGEECEDPLKALEAMFMTHIRFIAKHPGVPRILLGQLQTPRPTPAKRMVRSLLKQYGGHIEQHLEKARKAGHLRSEIDTAAAAVHFIGTLQGLVLQSLIAGNIRQIVVQAPAAFDIFLNGIRKHEPVKDD